MISILNFFKSSSCQINIIIWGVGMLTTVNLQTCYRNYFYIFRKLMQNWNQNSLCKISDFCQFFRIFPGFFCCYRTSQKRLEIFTKVIKVTFVLTSRMVYVSQQCWDISHDCWDHSDNFTQCGSNWPKSAKCKKPK